MSAADLDSDEDTERAENIGAIKKRLYRKEAELNGASTKLVHEATQHVAALLKLTTEPAKLYIERLEKQSTRDAARIAELEAKRDELAAVREELLSQAHERALISQQYASEQGRKDAIVQLAQDRLPKLLDMWIGLPKSLGTGSAENFCDVVDPKLSDLSDAELALALLRSIDREMLLGLQGADGVLPPLARQLLGEYLDRQKQQSNGHAASAHA